MAQRSRRVRSSNTDDTSSDDSSSDITRRVAENLRVIRRMRGYSLEDVAALSGVSRAMLSHIESHKTNPTIGLLWKIASGLNLPFSALLGESSRERVAVVRRQETQAIRSADGVLESRPLVPARALANVELYHLRISPRSTYVADGHAVGTTEAATVTAGILRLHVGQRTYDAGLGDTIVFPADVEHAYENPGKLVLEVHDLVVYARTSS